MSGKARRIYLDPYAPSVGTEPESEAASLFFGCAEPLPVEPPVEPRYRKTLTVNGETKTLKEWAASSGIKLMTLRGRVRECWADEECVRPIRASHVPRYTYGDDSGKKRTP